MAKLLRLVLAMTAALIASSVASACPPNTVFSAFNGRGLCLIPGQGLTPVAECFLKKGACPAGFVVHNKHSDAANFYCCPTVVRDVRQCERDCRPLLQSIPEFKERMRVYRNCITGCNFGETLTVCDDGKVIHSKGQCAGAVSK